MTFAKIDNGWEEWTQQEKLCATTATTFPTSTTKKTLMMTGMTLMTTWRTRNEPSSRKSPVRPDRHHLPSRERSPWTVQDNRKALKSELPCRTKADVLDKIAIILDDMHNPPSKLDQNNDHVEVTVAVTLQASLCDLGTEVNILDLRRSVAEAVANAVHHHEQVGFDHSLADRVSLGVVEVRALNVE